MTTENIKAGFCSVGLLLYNPQVVLSKLNIKLQMLTPIRSSLLEADLWISRTLYDPAEAISQSEFVRNRMSIYQGSSLTSMVSIVKQLAKGTELMVYYRMIFMEDKLRTLRKANEAFAKRRKVKRIRLQARGTFIIETV
jgi:hypothetical protein